MNKRANIYADPNIEKYIHHIKSGLKRPDTALRFIFANTKLPYMNALTGAATKELPLSKLWICAKIIFPYQ